MATLVLWLWRLAVIVVAARVVVADMLMDALSAFVNVNGMAGDAKTILALVEEMKRNETTVRFDSTFPLSPHDLGLLFQLYDKCGTSESQALLTWCTGVPPNGTSLDGETLCPRGVRTHPCTGRVLDVSKDTDHAQFLWPWQGIKCDAFTDPTTITNIYLPDQGLKCRLQDLDFSRMVSLEQLDLSGNELFGPFPSWLGNMTMLRFLNLRENEIASNLPLSVGDNMAIEVIDLAHNQLTAPSLSFFKVFKRLRYLDLAGNKFNLSLPSGFFSGQYLEYLNLSHNSFHGVLPPLPTLKHLVAFDVSNNSFQGELPRVMNTWGRTDPNDPAEEPITETLDFSHNQFSGSIPPFFNLTSLLRFAVHSNQLSGFLPQLPISLYSRRTPQYFAGNNFSCPLPQLTPDPLDFGNLTCTCKNGRRRTHRRNRHNDGTPVATFDPIPAAHAVNECKSCPRGSYSNATSNNTCVQCPVGHIPNRTDTASELDVATECVACGPGTFANVTGSEQCTKCLPGTASNVSGQATCAKCFPGEFVEEEGSVACKPCAPGSASRRHGSATCEPCQPGTFVAFGGEFACLPCPRGQFQDREGATACQECPIGHVAPLVGQIVCQPCRAGTFFDSTARSCFKCPPNTFTDQDAQTQCRPCSNDMAADGVGNARCEQRVAAGFGRRHGRQAGNNSTDREEECLPGYFNNGSTVACQPCPLGTFARAPRASRCELCSPGTFSNTIASTSCALAPVGTFVAVAGAWRPSRCPPGQYVDVEGSARCKPCDAETSSVFGSRTHCEPLVEGQVLQVVTWPQVELSLVGISADDLASNEALQRELLTAWRLAQIANGVSRVEPHVLDVVIEGATPSSGRVVVYLALEPQLPPLRPLKRASLTDTLVPGLHDAFTNATHAITTTKDTATDWFERLTGKAITSSDYTRLPHANVTDVIPSTAFQTSLSRQLRHASMPQLRVAASLLVVQLSSSPFTSTRAIGCPRGSFFTRDEASQQRRCVPCPPGTFASIEGQLHACLPCPIGHVSPVSGAEICDVCPWGHGALEGATVCETCTFFSRACGDFWKNVVLTALAALVTGLTAWRRAHEMWSGPRVRCAQQESESAALVAAVRTFGRV